MSDDDFVDYGACKECEKGNTGPLWCKECNAKRLQQNFKNWTSGNDNIDEFIQRTQLSATRNNEILEWIPYDRFYDIEYIAKGGFGEVYKTKWIDGWIYFWNWKVKSWKRGQNMVVALKCLDNSKNITLEFIDEITSHHKLNDNYIISLYGITQNPETKNYMMVLQYAEKGSLRNYLDTNKDDMSWGDKILNLSHIASGLNTIHRRNLIHRDLHIGNILRTSDYARITDFGLCKPADYNNKLENANNSVYGVLPYVAPEILGGQIYTKASDIYSFGIIMYEVISGLPPYYDMSHDQSLAINICSGLRPNFNIKVPQLIVNLIKRCLDANPLNRPVAHELNQILSRWYDELYQDKQTELKKQTEEADEINNNLKNSNPSSPSTGLGLSYETHAKAIYTSRLLNFNNLPESKNSDDYYEQNDNIMSKEFSEEN